MTLHRVSRYSLALALFVLPAAAGAQAFGLNEIGSCALARGFATTSLPCDDASSIYWNPGAMPGKRGFSLYGGAAIIKIGGSFTQDTTHMEYQGDVPTAIVPHVFLNYRGAGRMAYGLGVYVPYGLTSQWSDSFPGRFAAKKASLQTIYFQPNLTYAINDRWSVGGGPIIAHSSVELVQGVDLSGQVATVVNNNPITFGQLGIAKRTEFARARLKGSDMGYGFTFGLQGKLTPNWQMGARFLSQVAFNYDNADATFTQVMTGLTLAAGNPITPGGVSLPVDQVVAGSFATGPLTPQKVQTQIQHPAQVQVGFAYTGFERTTLSLDYSYVGWKSFSNLPVNFQNTALSKVLVEEYNNTSGIRFGVEHRLVNGAALRAGLAGNTSAAPEQTVTPLLPEQDRGFGMLGGGLPITSGLTVDAAYAHVFTSGRRGRIDERAVGSTDAQAIALNSGFYSLNANIFSLSLKANF